MTKANRRSFLERILRVVTDVRTAEGPTALLMAVNGFILLMAYYCVKPVREALILSQPGGAEYKVYMAGATAVVLIFAVPTYAHVSRNMARNRLVVGVTLFFASHLIVFYGLARLMGSSLPFALGFYLWIAVFNMMIVAQFWAFANDVYDEDAGKRLFPLIGLGASVGALAGSAAASAMVARVGVLEMMPLASALLVGSAALTEGVHRREVRRATSAARLTALQPIGGTAGDAFRAVLAQRFLLLIALFSLLFTLVKTNGDYLLARIVQGAAREAVAAGALDARHMQNYIGGVFAGYEFNVGLISLLVQAFAVSRLVKYLGIGGAFLVLPIVALGDAALMVAVPTLAAVRFGKTAESAIDYSLNNTLRGMLWLPTSRRAKYLAKQATDTFFVRTGDVMSALLVFIGTHVLSLSVRGFAGVNLALVGAWLLLARAIAKERERLGTDGEVLSDPAVHARTADARLSRSVSDPWPRSRRITDVGGL